MGENPLNKKNAKLFDEQGRENTCKLVEMLLFGGWR